MPFLNKVPHPCNCDKPNAKDADYWIGTRWQCDKCKAVYELQDDQRDGLYWRGVMQQ
jgi:hypothetical protein